MENNNTGGAVHADAAAIPADEQKKMAEVEELIKKLPDDLKAEIVKIKSLPEAQREAAYLKFIADLKEKAAAEAASAVPTGPKPAPTRVVTDPVVQKNDDDDEGKPASDGLSGWAWAGIIAGCIAAGGLLAWLICSWTSSDSITTES